jgi:hypothetical protein
MYKIHKGVTGGHDPDSDSGQTARNPPSRHPDPLSKHSTIFHVVTYSLDNVCAFSKVLLKLNILKGGCELGALALRAVLQHGYMCTYCEQLLNMMC